MRFHLRIFLLYFGFSTHTSAMGVYSWPPPWGLGLHNGSRSQTEGTIIFTIQKEFEVFEVERLHVIINCHHNITMPGETSLKEKWAFTKGRALTFIDQTHISEFPSWHVHSPACAVHLEHVVSVGRQDAGKSRLDITHASAHSHLTLDKLLNSRNFFSVYCESSLKTQKGLCHRPDKGSKTENHIFSSDVTWDVPLWSLPWPFQSIFRCRHYTNKSKHLKNTWVCAKGFLFNPACLKLPSRSEQMDVFLYPYSHHHCHHLLPSHIVEHLHCTKHSARKSVGIQRLIVMVPKRI